MIHQGLCTPPMTQYKLLYQTKRCFNVPFKYIFHSISTQLTREFAVLYVLFQTVDRALCELIILKFESLSISYCFSVNTITPKFPHSPSISLSPCMYDISIVSPIYRIFSVSFPDLSLWFMPLQKPISKWNVFFYVKRLLLDVICIIEYNHTQSHANKFSESILCAIFSRCAQSGASISM